MNREKYFKYLNEIYSYYKENNVIYIFYWIFYVKTK